MANNTMVAFYATQDQANDAFLKLRKSGFKKEMLSIITTKHEVLKNETHGIAGDFMLQVFGTKGGVEKAAKLLAICILKENAKQDGHERVLSGGDTSSFQ